MSETGRTPSIPVPDGVRADGTGGARGGSGICNAAPRAYFPRVPFATHPLLPDATRFLVAGAVAAFAQVTVLVLLVDILGLASWISGGLAFFAAVSIAWILQSAWVFAGRGGRGRMARYALLVGCGILANMGAIHVSTEIFAAGWMPGWAMASTIVPAANFLAGRFWVFA